MCARSPLRRMPTVSIVIPAHNEERSIAACLRACTAKLPPEVLEVLVIDNASTDATAAVARRFPRVRVVREPRKGLTRARQRALREAKGELLAFFDADTLPPEGWIDRVREEFADSSVVCLSGPIDYHDLPPVPRMVQDCIDTMTAMNVRVAFLPLGVLGDLVQHPELRPAIVERLQAIGPKAEAAGVVIGIETALDAAGQGKRLPGTGSPATWRTAPPAT